MMLCSSISGKCGVRRIDGTHVRLSYRGDIERRFEQISRRFKYVCIHASSWETLVTNAQLQKPTGIYLDPPYDKTERVYRKCESVSSTVEAWCIEQSDSPHRIVLSGYDDEHDALLEFGWGKEETKKATAGSGALGNSTNTEQLWYSPNCLKDCSGKLF